MELFFQWGMFQLGHGLLLRIILVTAAEERHLVLLVKIYSHFLCKICRKWSAPAFAFV